MSSGRWFALGYMAGVCVPAILLLVFGHEAGPWIVLSVMATLTGAAVVFMWPAIEIEDDEKP